MKIKITENQLRHIITETISNILSEEQKLIDNFDKVARMMEFNSNDDFYFVQIVKRYKDNPNDDRTQGNYHAGGWYPYKGYRIHSSDELLNLKPEIIKLCHQSNARAYITINNRSAKETDAQIIKVKKMYAPSDPRHQNADDIVPSQAKHGRNWKGKRLKFFIDVDTNNKKIWNEVHNIINMCGINIIDEYETPSGGLHIILPNKEDKNIEYLEHLLRKFDKWQNKGRLALAHPNFDGRIILYSNVKTAGY